MMLLRCAAEFKQQNVAQALKVTFDTLPMYVCMSVRLSKLRVSLLKCVRVRVCVCRCVGVFVCATLTA